MSLAPPDDGVKKLNSVHESGYGPPAVPGSARRSRRSLSDAEPRRPAAGGSLALSPSQPQLWSTANSPGSSGIAGELGGRAPCTPAAAEPPSQQPPGTCAHQSSRGRVCPKPLQGFFPVLSYNTPGDTRALLQQRVPSTCLALWGLSDASSLSCVSGVFGERRLILAPEDVARLKSQQDVPAAAQGSFTAAGPSGKVFVYRQK